MLIAIYSSKPCATPEKQRYTSEDEAYVAADYIFDSSDKSLEPYLCDCGLWHLTTPLGSRDEGPAALPPDNGSKAAQLRRRWQPLPPHGKSGRRPKPPG